VKLEDAAALGGTLRIVDIDTVDEANERRTEGNAPDERTVRLAKEVDPLRLVELDRGHLLGPTALPDRRPTRGA
jgi:hypothetical protein